MSLKPDGTALNTWGKKTYSVRRTISERTGIIKFNGGEKNDWGRDGGLLRNRILTREERRGCRK